MVTLSIATLELTIGTIDATLLHVFADIDKLLLVCEVNVRFS